MEPVELPLERQDELFEQIVCRFSREYGTKDISTERLFNSGLKSNMCVLRGMGFNITRVCNLWEERGWIARNKELLGGSIGGTTMMEF